MHIFREILVRFARELVLETSVPLRCRIVRFLVKVVSLAFRSRLRSPLLLRLNSQDGLLFLSSPSLVDGHANFGDRIAELLKF